MKQWFYCEDGGQRGPVPEETLRSMHRSGKLRDDSLVWTDGMDGWRKIDTLPGWETSPYESPASAMEGEVAPVVWDGYEPTGAQVRPWVRYWARTLDMFLAMVGTGMTLGLLAPALLEIPDVLMGVVVLAGTLVTEPLCFALFGTTPGKALLNVRVRDRDGRKLSFARAFVRRLHIMIRGEGLGIPFLSLVTHIVAYSRLTNHGVTSWDERLGCEVSHREIAWWRWLLFLVVFAGFLALFVWGSEQA